MLTIRLDSDEPIVDQITHGIRAAIAAGAVVTGDELPPVRQLAADLGVNLNTVARGYRALEALGLVRTARGRGTRVTATRETRAEDRRATTKRVREAVHAALADAKLAGLDRAATLRIIETHLEQLWPDGQENR